MHQAACQLLQCKSTGRLRLGLITHHVTAPTPHILLPSHLSAREWVVLWPVEMKHLPLQPIQLSRFNLGTHRVKYSYELFWVYEVYLPPRVDASVCPATASDGQHLVFCLEIAVSCGPKELPKSPFQAGLDSKMTATQVAIALRLPSFEIRSVICPGSLKALVRFWWPDPS